MGMIFLVNVLRTPQGTPAGLIDLASMVGFENQRCFIKVFKKIVGVSPGKHRENRGNILHKKE